MLSPRIQRAVFPAWEILHLSPRHPFLLFHNRQTRVSLASSLPDLDTERGLTADLHVCNSQALARLGVRLRRYIELLLGLAGGLV